MKYIRGFLRFWYDFIVGDDWRAAVMLLLLIGATAAVAGTDASAWWLMPVGVAAILFGSLRRAVSGSRG